MISKFKQVNKVTAESVSKNTGRDWQQWHEALNKIHAQNFTHKELVQTLKSKYKLTPWWQQIVASGFEVMIGKKMEGRNAKGEFSITVTKTIHVPPKKLWTFLTSKAGTEIWLKPLSLNEDGMTFHIKTEFETEDGYFGEIRTISKGKKIRMSWMDPEWNKKSYFTLYIHSRDNKKCMLIFTHEGLVDGRLRAPLRQRWEDASKMIHQYLTSK